jgi:hypothetical protein
MRLHSDGNFDLILSDDTPDKPYFKTTKKEYFKKLKKEREKLWRLNHYHKHIFTPESLSKLRKWDKEHPEIKRTRNAKQRAKRRELGFISLNKPFVGSEAHHIDKEYVIFIPKELHQSIPHNVWTGKGMKLINAEAMRFCLITARSLKANFSDFLIT